MDHSVPPPPYTEDIVVDTVVDDIVVDAPSAPTLDKLSFATKQNDEDVITFEDHGSTEESEREEIVCVHGIFRYENPNRTKSEAISHMYIVIAALMAAMSLMLAITSAATAPEHASFDSSGVSAVVFGGISSIFLLITALVAFLSHHYAKMMDTILYHSTLVFLSLSLVSMLVLMATAISADVEARKMHSSFMKMTILCIFAAAVGIPFVATMSLSIAMSMFLRCQCDTMC